MNSNGARPKQAQLSCDWDIRTDRGPRPENQDQALAILPESHAEIRKKGVLLVLCDGVGGLRGGQRAADVASRTALSAYYDDASGAEPEQALGYAIEQANTAVRAEAARTPEASNMATTIVMAAVVDSRLYVANVGDSRAYLYHDGHLEQVSTDHSWVGEQVRLGAMTLEQARQSTLRNFITRSLGSAGNNIPEFAQRDLQSGNRVLLCTDGVHGAVSDDDMAAQLERNAKADDAAGAILDLALAHETKDNATVAVLDCAGKRPAALPVIPVLAGLLALILLVAGGTFVFMDGLTNGRPGATPLPAGIPAATAIMREVTMTPATSATSVLTVVTDTQSNLGAQATSTIAILPTATFTLTTPTWVFTGTSRSRP